MIFFMEFLPLIHFSGNKTLFLTVEMIIGLFTTKGNPYG